MRKYTIKDRLFYDGYGLNQKDLASSQFIGEFLERINKKIFNKKGQITLIPYFNGKVKKDGGISGLILGNNFHFTCHTFCYKNTVFIDYYGKDEKREAVIKEIFNTFKTNDYDLGSRSVKGNFGRHIIFETNPIQIEDTKDIIEKILKRVKMTPIFEPIIYKANSKSFDVLQLIAESHISFHQHNDKLIVDVFSCKKYDIDKVLSLFPRCVNVKEVHRGLRYK